MAYNSDEILNAIDLLIEEIMNENSRILKEGGEEMMKGNMTVAQKALDFAHKIKSFSEKVNQLKNDWTILKSEIDATSPEVQKILTPSQHQDIIDSEVKAIIQPSHQHDIDHLELHKVTFNSKPRKDKTGYTRNVTSVGPRTNFTVTFPDGTVIKAPTANKVYAMAIDKIGVERIAEMGLLLCSEPIVSQTRDVYLKKPSQVEELSNGWFVKSHCSTDRKIGILKTINTTLKLNLVFEMI